MCGCSWEFSSPSVSTTRNRRSGALRAAQLGLMQSSGAGYSLAHPLFWAPYALIGDGGR
jgi:CHAT domain-containing protein